MNNKTEQIGGSYKNIVNFMYIKNHYIKNYDMGKSAGAKKGILQEKFTKLYLVDENLDAYEMYEIYTKSGIYILSLSLESNKLFKFKFMKNENVEYLDEDKFLKTTVAGVDEQMPLSVDPLKWPANYQFTNTVDHASFKNPITVGFKDSIHNVFAWKTRWRWIYPTQNNNNQVFIFTLYVPNIRLVNSTTSMRNSTNFDEDIVNQIDVENCWEDYLIQNDITEILLKNGGKKDKEKKIKLKSVNIGNNKSSEQLNYAKVILLHNLGYPQLNKYKLETIFSDGPSDDISTIILKLYNILSCRNANILEYYERFIKSVIESAISNISLLKLKISSLLSKTKADMCDLLSGDSQITYFQTTLGDTPDYSTNTLPNVAHIYYFQQLSNNIRVNPPGIRENYKVLINDFIIEIKQINIQIIQNAFHTTIINLINKDILENLKLINGKPFASLNTLSVVQYKDFVINSNKESKKYLEKWIVLNLLLNSFFGKNKFPQGPEELFIAGIKYSSDEWKSAPTWTAGRTDLTDAQKVHNKFTMTIFSLINETYFGRATDNNFTTATLATTQTFFQTSILLREIDSRKLLDVNLKYFLTLDWIHTNLFGLLYAYDNEKSIGSGGSDIRYLDYKFKLRLKLKADLTFDGGISDEAQNNSTLMRLYNNLENNGKNEVGSGAQGSSVVIEYTDYFTKIVDLVPRNISTLFLGVLSSSVNSSDFNNLMDTVFSINDSTNVIIENFSVFNNFYKYKSVYVENQLRKINQLDAENIKANNNMIFYYYNRSFKNTFVDPYVDGRYVDRLNYFLSIFEKNIYSLRESYWISTSNIRLSDFINNLNKKNKEKLFAKLLLLITFLKNPPNISPIKMVNKIVKVNVNSSLKNFTEESIFILKDRKLKYQNNDLNESPDPVEERPPIEFLELINKNNTIVQLIKLATYHIVGKKSAIKLNKVLFTDPESILNDPLFKNNFIHSDESSQLLTMFTGSGLPFKDTLITTKSIFVCLSKIIIATEWPLFVEAVDKLYKEYIVSNSSLQQSYPIYDLEEQLSY